MATKEAADPLELEYRRWTFRALVEAGGAKRMLERSGELDGTVARTLGIPDFEGVKAALALRSLRCRLQEAEDAFRPGSVLRENVGHLAALADLSPVEAEVLALAVAAAHYEPLEDTLRAVAAGNERRLALVAARILGTGVAAVREALAPRGILRTSGLLKVEWTDQYRRDWPIGVRNGLDDLLLAEHDGAESFAAHFFRPGAPARLRVDDYPHAAADVELIVRLLGTALADRRAGANVLIHGPPGTGKTQLARTLARAASARLVEVADEDPDGDPISASRRLTAYVLCQRLLRVSPGALILFDEAEDAFGSKEEEDFFGSARTRWSKAWMNRLLEENPAPSIWTLNDVTRLDPAFVRRFDYVLELKAPPPAIRRKMLEAELGGALVGEPFLRQVAADERVTPAHIARAAGVAKRIARNGLETEDVLGRVLAGSLAILGRAAAPPPVPDGPAYDPGLVRATVDLAALADALVRRPAGAICLYGPPGTGKTAWVRHVAERLGRPLLQKKGSDLLGPFVGLTEARIADAFREARDAGAVLLLDEVDGFLQDRGMARHSWEVTQVNELLVQIEGFDGLLFCATNLVDRLDAASLRRFAVKIRFDPPDRDARWRLFGLALAALGGGAPEPGLRAELDRLDGLTPGDFAAVIRKLRLLGGAEPDEVLRALAEERAIKPEVREARREIGFGAVA